MIYDVETNKEIAHLFWHGELTKLEETCIKSFIKNGFDTKIWSYTGIQIEGAEACDARLVLPEENLNKYKQRHFEVNDGSKKFYSSMAAFSDAFRWNVVNKFGGWWFDTDCYCLKPAEEFTKLRENKPLVACIQNHECPSINSGVFYADKNTCSKLVERLNQICDYCNYNFPEWGLIGPMLISSVVQNNNLENHILTTDNFYSIEYNQFDFFINPDSKELAKSYIKDSFICHIWHSQLSLHNVDKNNPLRQSLLDEFYSGNYTNDIPVNKERILQYKKALERYISVSKIYKNVLKRPGDFVGIGSYVRSKLSDVEIEKIFKSSEEYKQRKLDNNE
jgi:hypothetical protein